MTRNLALILCLLTLISAPAWAGIVNVPGDYAQIHDAVQACAAGDTVLVAPGTYGDCTHPTEGAESTPACVIMKSGVTLRGSGTDQTIIDADGLGRGIFVEDVANCRIENLQVTDAFATIYGAGILLREVDDTVTITDVLIHANLDGGIICFDHAAPILTRVTMTDNYAKQGGGLAVEEFSDAQVYDCYIANNESPSGAGVFIRSNCNVIMTGCTFENNVIDSENGNGGGVAVQSAHADISDCIFRNNTTLGFGGGVAYVSGATGTLENCLIENNVASGSQSAGGGVGVKASDPTLRNLVIVGNSATGSFSSGGGISIHLTPSPTIENCTIDNNSAGPNEAGGGIAVGWFAAPTIRHCIITNATSGPGLVCAIDNFAGTPTVTNCNIWNNAGGDDLCGTDNGFNFSADPEFCGTQDHEYNLGATSPCLDGNHPGGGSGLIGALGGGCGGIGVPIDLARKISVGNWPNPFNPTTNIYFDLPHEGSARLSIFDVKGRLILERSWNSLAAGRTEFQWLGYDSQGRSVPSGTYLYRVDSGNLHTSRRMSLVR